MKINASFTYNGKKHNVERDCSKLDRNYNDEDYALILVPIDGDFENGYFEINILKDAEIDGKLIEDGYVAIYGTFDDTIPDNTIPATITFA